MSKGASRRKFLKAGAIAGAALLAGAILKTSPATSQTPKTSRPPRKWVMVIDLDRCDGCQECTEACITEHMVPPAWGKPNYKGRQEWIKVYDLKQDLGQRGSKGNFLPVPCMHCENPPCVKVCPVVGATYRNDEGITLIDNEKCIGCRYCIAACPYERRFFNWGEPHTEEEKAKLVFAHSTPEYPVPHKKGTVGKCMFCAHRVIQGRLPACVEACTKKGMKAIYFGDAYEDAVTNGAEVVKLSELLSSRGASRLKEELGTEPRVYYLHPMETK